MPVDKLKETRPSDESNEQIINDLTNNLGNLNTNVENNTKVEDDIKNDDGDHEGPPQDDDFIDEVALKDQEINLSESERLQRKADADTAKSRGNDFFKIGEFSKALDEYTLGLRTCPLNYEQERSILYCNRSACKMKMQLTKSALEDCDKAIELNDKYVKAYVR